MTDQTSSETATDSTGRKLCPECAVRDSPRFSLDTDDDYATILHHYLDNHPDSDRFREVIEDTWIETQCRECGRPFFSPMKHAQEGMQCEAYCPECESEDWLKPLVVREVDPEELVEYQADPATDTLTRASNAEGDR